MRSETPELGLQSGGARRHRRLLSFRWFLLSVLFYSLLCLAVEGMLRANTVSSEWCRLRSTGVTKRP